MQLIAHGENMEIRAWLEEKVKEADQLFPGHGSFLAIIENTEDGDPAVYSASDIPHSVLEDYLPQLLEQLEHDTEEFKKGH